MGQDLYLCSVDYKQFNIVRTLVDYQRISLHGRKYLAVHCDPPVKLETEHGSTLDTEILYLTNRFVDQETQFLELSEFPLYVLVMVKDLDSVNEETKPTRTIAWASLHDTYSAAKKELDG